MGFDISLRKPSARLSEPNRIWVEIVSRKFTELREEAIDHRRVADELARDIGLSVDEYLARGIGLVLEDPVDPWMQVAFWDRIASITLPNSPKGGVRPALDKALPIIELLRSLGFELEDPSSGNLLPGPPLDALQDAYATRQRHVETVAKITGGTTH